MKDSPEFEKLCDLVASDQLVCVTGAGISLDLLRADGKRIPGWIQLIQELTAIADQEKSHLSSWHQTKQSIENLLFRDAPGKYVIEAASLLEKEWPAFNSQLLRALTPAPVSSQPLKVQRGSLTHNALLELGPRGILTFNVDDLHEHTLEDRNAAWVILNAADENDEQNMRALVAGNLRDHFLLKAHGSIRSTSHLVFTSESYRALLQKSPGYRAFVQNLLTNFHLLIVGFGLSDPDFDVFLETMVGQFGSPVREHNRGP